jgi:hypothetical protein
MKWHSSLFFFCLSHLSPRAMNARLHFRLHPGGADSARFELVRQLSCLDAGVSSAVAGIALVVASSEAVAIAGTATIASSALFLMRRIISTPLMKG